MNINQFVKYQEDVWILPTIKTQNIQEALTLVDSDRKGFGKWIISNFKKVKQEKNIPIKQPGERFWSFNYKMSDLNHFQEMIRLRFPQLSDREFMPANSYLSGESLATKAQQLAEVSKIVKNSSLEALCFLFEEFDKYNLQANLVCKRIPNYPRKIDLELILNDLKDLPADFQKKLIRLEDRKPQCHPHEIIASLIKEQLNSSIDSVCKGNSDNMLNLIDYLLLP